jgi:cytidylate kinase
MMIIAIDGPAAAGKGTIAQRLSDHYKLPYLDTGLLYRLVGRTMHERDLDLADAAAAGKIAASFDPADLADLGLRGYRAGELASRVAVHPEVRQALIAYQRDFAAQPEGAVLDGRDIGTVICPNADVKIYITASPEVRARRRTQQLNAKGRSVDYVTILSEIRSRDARDSGRATAPLKQAADAHVLDTSKLDIEAAVKGAIAIVDQVRTKRVPAR